MNRAIATTRRAAFTLVELIVVVAAIVIGIAVVLPAFTRAIESASYASAINTVTATLGQARALAMRTGAQTAVAFFFDVESQRTSIQVLVLDNQFGSLASSEAVSNPLSASCFVFVPAPNAVPVELPAGIGVYALSFATDAVGAESNDLGVPEEDPPYVAWYEGERIANPITGIYEPQWIFPRTDPRLFLPDGADPNNAGTLSGTTVANSLLHADTFFIRFTADGNALGSTDLGAGASKRNAYIEYPDLPYDPNDPEDMLDEQPDEFDPNIFYANGDPVVLNPEVHVRGADLLAIVDFPRMTAQTGVRRPWLYRSPSNRGAASDLINEGLTDGQATERIRNLSDWIDRNAEVIAFNRFTGNALRRGVE